ncbi:MAG: TonB-dependent receptor [Verrucomicrobiota bacterium JB022]|nr:TonB-dependent receptor [Verrucomicrobiota bacterium JB022]
MTPNLQTQAPGFPRSPRKAALFSLSFLLALAAGANLTLAQTASNETPDDDQVFELEEFVVTGMRESMIQSIEIKRGSYEMVDAIVAEDIGKFPDNNLVEALQRVSGVQVTDRAGGEVSTVSIRGLNDVNTTINGRNIFTSSGRHVSLQDIPASLLHRVDVYKTRSADQIETGIAGVIDIRTHRPFNFDGFKAVVAARGIYQEQADEFDPNLSALISNTWELQGGARLGVLFNVSYAETNYRDQSVTPGAAVPFVNGTPPAPWTPYERIFLEREGVSPIVEGGDLWEPGLDAGLPYAEGSTLPMIIDGQTVQVPYLLSRDAIFQSDLLGSRERPAGNLSIQYAPNDWSEYVFEAFYNGYRNETSNSLLFSFADWWGALGDDPEVELYPGTNIIKSRRVGAPYGFTSGDITRSETDSYLYAVGGRWDIGDNLTLKSEITYQTSEFKEEFFGMRFDRVFDSIDIDFNSKGGLPAFSFGDNPTTAADESSLTDPSLWTVAQLYDNSVRHEGEAWTYTTDGDYKLDWPVLESLKFGVRYDDRSASEADRPQAAVPFLGQPLSSFPEFGSTNSGFFDGRADIPSSWLSADGDFIFDNREAIRQLYRNTLDDPTIYNNPIEKNFDVEEATTSAYLMSTFATELFGRKLDGQFGVRYVTVTTDMQFGETVSVDVEKFLPSASVRYSLTEDLRLRLSYGETLRRPNFSQLNPNLNLVDDVTNIGYGEATSGNPYLDPTTSKNYDISLEYYFGEGNAIYGTWFKREVEGLVETFRSRIIAQNAQGEDYPYILTRPDNTSDGTLDGFEFGLIYFPESLPSVLDGFGVQASLTLLDSEQTIPVTNNQGEVVREDRRPFFGVSDTSYSVVLAYERGPVSARLGYVWRDNFMNEYEAPQFANPRGVYRTPDKSLDLQVSWAVTEALTVTFDATNLTQETFHSYYEDEDLFNFGNWIVSRTFAVGMRYDF